VTDRTGPDTDQPELVPGLVRASVRRARTKAAKGDAPGAEPAEVDPVARVLVDLPLAHLDRTFDYLVPARFADEALPGTRVKVRFAGQDVDALVLERVPVSDHAGRLTPIRRVVSSEPVLRPEIAELAGEVAARYAGTRADVLRLAVPPRHATTEKQPSDNTAPPTVDVVAAADAWSGHGDGPAYVRSLASGGSPRAVWSAAPGTAPAQPGWPDLLAHAAAATYAGGRGVLLLVPDGKDLARLGKALRGVLGEGHHVALSADAGPAARYADFLAVARGSRRVVAGTRAAMFAPVRDLGLVAIWDDGDDLHAEPRAPYPHAREVLLMRAARQGCAVLVGGHARTVEAEYLLRTGWAREITAPREELRRRLTVDVSGAGDHDLARDPHGRAARIPRQAHELVRDALVSGPVLVQTPRSGYAPSLACERCRTPARCVECHGPLRLDTPTRPPACGWCGRVDPAWACPECGHRGLRAPVVGETRTAEELGRAFPGTSVQTSGGSHVLSTSGSRGIVVATPGAEPVSPDGYAAVLLLDTWLALARTDLRVGEESLRRWMNAAALVRPGGRVLVVGDPATPALQALVRWDPAGFAAREMAERQSAHLPPASRFATVSGAPGAVDDALTLLDLPGDAELLGPVPDGEESSAVVRVPRRTGARLSAALREMQRLRSARKLDAVRVRVDPATL
jgi:primosomal protein N' (replication factor Y)